MANTPKPKNYIRDIEILKENNNFSPFFQIDILEDGFLVTIPTERYLPNAEKWGIIFPKIKYEFLEESSILKYGDLFYYKTYPIFNDVEPTSSEIIFATAIMVEDSNWFHTNGLRSISCFSEQYIIKLLLYSQKKSNWGYTKNLFLEPSINEFAEFDHFNKQRFIPRIANLLYSAIRDVSGSFDFLLNCVFLSNLSKIKNLTHISLMGWIEELYEKIGLTIQHCTEISLFGVQRTPFKILNVLISDVNKLMAFFEYTKKKKVKSKIISFWKENYKEAMVMERSYLRSGMAFMEEFNLSAIKKDVVNETMNFIHALINYSNEN